MTPNQKNPSLLTTVTSVQTIPSCRLAPLYVQSVPSTVPQQSRTLDITQALTTSWEESASQLDREKNPRKSDNNLVVDHVSVSCSSPPRVGNETLKSPVIVQETFESQLVSPLKFSIPLSDNQDNVKLPRVPSKRRHTSSVCSSNSAEDSLSGRSRCSQCDGCSVSSRISQNASPRLSVEDDVQPLQQMADWATKEEDFRGRLLMQMQDDVSGLFNSFDSADNKLHQCLNNQSVLGKVRSPASVKLLYK